MRDVEKTIPVRIECAVGRQDAATGTFQGGVAEPEFLDELHVDVFYPDMAYEESLDDVVATGRHQLHISGSQRAIAAFAHYLIAIAEYGCDPAVTDPDYHDHFDLTDRRGIPSVHLIVHAPHE